MTAEQARDSNVGYIGVGHMGRHMAASLIGAGYALVICDQRQEARDEAMLAGATWVDTPQRVAELCRTTITTLPGPAEVDQVVLGACGILAGTRAGDYYIDMSTSSPTSIRAIAAAAELSGVEVIDAPVAGGTRGARHGTLTIMVGASDAAFAACLPLFRAMGERIIHVGGVGSGHVAKLVNNMMTIANGIAAMEAMVVGTKAGVSPARLMEVAQAGTGNSFSLNLFPHVIFKGNFDPAKFALSLATKDLRISEEFAQELGVHLRVIPSILSAMTDACDSGLRDSDWSSYITLLEDASNVKVRSPEAGA